MRNRLQRITTFGNPDWTMFLILGLWLVRKQKTAEAQEEWETRPSSTVIQETTTSSYRTRR